MLLAQFEPTKTDTALADAYRWCLGAALRLARGGHVPKMRQIITDYSRPKSELLRTLAGHVRPHVAKFRPGFAKRVEQALRHPSLKSISPDHLPAAKPSRAQVQPAAALSFPQVARPAPAATPVVAARPAVAVTAPKQINQREYDECLRRWMIHQNVKHSGGKKYQAAIADMIVLVKTGGKPAAYAKMQSDLSTK